MSGPVKRKTSEENVKDALEVFKMEHDPKKRIEEYRNVLEFFLAYLTSAAQNTTRQVIIYIMEELLKCREPYADLEILEFTIRTLIMAQEMTNYIPKSYLVMPLFTMAARLSQLNKNILDGAELLFKALFNDRQFCNDFIENDGAIVVMRDILLRTTNPDAVEWVLRVVTQNVKNFSNLCVNNFTLEFGKIDTTSITEEKKIDQILSFFIWFYGNARGQGKKISELALNWKTFDVYCSFVTKLPERKWETCYSAILCTDDDDRSCPPNLIFLRALKGFCLREVKSAPTVFALLKIYYTETEMIAGSVNSVFPGVLWYSRFRLPTDQSILFLANIDETIPSYTRECMPLMLQRLSETPMIAPEPYNKLLMIIDDCLTTKRITLDDLVKWGFMDAFIMSPDPETKAKIWCDPKNKLETVIEMYKMISESNRMLVFQAILSCGLFCSSASSFFRLSVDFFTIMPSKDKMFVLLEWITKTNNISGCDMLKASFFNDAVIAEHFVECDGITWLDAGFQSGLISLSLYADLISHLVVLRRFDEIDDYMMKLPADHPIFSLPKVELESIAYGRNRDKYRPIRVHSLIRRIGLPSDIDPYNAWILGNFVVEQYLKQGYDIFDVPKISEIGNRFLLQEHADMLMDRPFELFKYCNTQYDHFPLFQFFQGRASLQIAMQFKAISFWVKYAGGFSVGVRVFHSDGVEVRINQGKIKLCVDGAGSDELDIDVQAWNHIFLVANETWFTSTVSLFVNGQELKLSRKGKGKFYCACFESIAPSLMFIGSAIRLYETSIDQYNIVQEKGPGFMDSLINDETILLPYTFASPFETKPKSPKNWIIPSNCVGVPYFGLPFHFMSNRKVYQLFDILEEAQSAQDFSCLVDVILNINSITMRNSSRFWTRLLSVLKKHQEYVTDEMFAKAFEMVCGLANRLNKSGSDVTAIMMDPEMWKSVDNKKLIKYMFTNAKTADWSQIPDIDMFLTEVVLKNMTDEDLALLIIEHNSEIPRVMRNIITCAKCDLREIRGQDVDLTVMQITIFNAVSRFVNNKTAEMVAKWFPFDDLQVMLSTRNSKVGARVLHLMFVISRYIPNYIHVNHIFLYGITRLSKIQDVWNEIGVFATGETFWCHAPLVRKEALPMMLALVWAVTLCIMYSCSFCRGDFHSVDAAHDSYVWALTFCANHTSDIINDEICLDMIVSWFPAVLASSFLIHNIVTGESELTSENTFVDVLRDVSVIVRMMGEVLDDYGFVIPIGQVFSPHPIVGWISESPLVVLLCQLLIEANPSQFDRIAPPIILCVPFFYQQWIQMYAPALIHVFFGCSIRSSRTSSINLIMPYLSFLLKLDCFAVGPGKFIDDVLVGLKRLEYGKSVIEFMIMLLYLGQSVPDSLVGGIAEKITASKMLRYFFSIDRVYVLAMESILAKRNISNLDIPVDPNAPPVTLPPDFVKTKIATIDDAFEKMKAKITRIRENYQSTLKKSYDAVDRVISKFNAEVQEEAGKLVQNLAFFDSSFTLSQERIRWRQFVNSVADRATDISGFDPKLFIPSPRVFPYRPSMVTRPSYFATTADAIDLYRMHVSADALMHEAHGTNVDLKLFFKQFGKPSFMDNCRIKRLAIDIPAVIFMHHDHCVILSYAELNEAQTHINLLEMSGDGFDEFVEAILNLQFGKTSLFLGHIAIEMFQKMHIHARDYHENGIEIWSFITGHFILEVSSTKVNYRAEFQKWNHKVAAVLPNMKDLMQISNAKTAQLSWNSGQLTDADYLLWINGLLANRSFADLNNMPQFPESSVPHIAINSTAGLCDARIYYSSDFYSKFKNPLAALSANCESLCVSKIAQFVEDYCSRDARMPRMGDLDGIYLNQWVSSELKSGHNMSFNGNKLISVGKLSCVISTSPATIVKVSRKKQSLIFKDVKMGEIIFSEFDHIFVFVNSIRVSHNGMLLVVDFVFGLTRVYLIKYANMKPDHLMFLSEFSWYAEPRSVVSGYNWLVATARNKELVLWDAITGSVHRRVDIGASLDLIEFDEAFGIWVATENRIFYVSINDSIACECSFSGATCICAIQNKDHMMDRAAICGTQSGRLLLLCPRIDTGEIDMIELPSEHQCAIEGVVVNASLTQFLTVDKNREISLWTLMGLKTTPTLEISVFSNHKCPLCEKEPVKVFCSSCNRAICQSCASSDGLCGVCLGTIFCL